MTASVPAKPASTVILLRDGAAGLEVLLMTRHYAIDFASGASVFPGGKVAEADWDPGLRDAVVDLGGMTDVALAYRIAAIREAFEESGILLAYDRASGRPVDPERVSDLGTRYRTRLEANEVTMLELAEQAEITFACDQLTRFAHWITPAVVPKRFDTQFYMMAVPPEQDGIARHDGRETVASGWVRPLDAVAEADASSRVMVFATRLNLMKLGRHANVAAALQAARQSDIVAVEPVVERVEGGRWLTIPEAADYGVTRVFVSETG